MLKNYFILYTSIGTKPMILHIYSYQCLLEVERRDQKFYELSANNRVQFQICI